MPSRRLPVRPSLAQFRRQARELLKAIRSGDPDAVAELREHHPDRPDPTEAKLSDAQLVLARSYDASSWTRLVYSVRLIEAIRRDDPDEVRGFVTGNPALLCEDVLIRTSSPAPSMLPRCIRSPRRAGGSRTGPRGRPSTERRSSTWRPTSTSSGSPSG